MKVILVAPHLNLGGGGGSERQTIALANALVRRGCKVTVLLTDAKGDLVSRLSDGVEVVFQGLKANFFSRFFLIYRTAKAKKPGILYSRLWRTKPATVLAGKILGTRTVLVEDNNIKEKLKLQPPVIRNITELAKFLCYKMADCVVAVSREGAEQISNMTGKKVHTIYNGIDIDEIERQSEEKTTNRWFEGDVPVAVAVGRLRSQKGYENLIEAVSEVNRTTPLRLLIIGGGPLKCKLAGKAEKLGIRDKVDFTGPVSNPHRYTAKCDVFICSSLFEGFGMVLAEALALGMPVVSTDYKYGAGEIVEDGKSGILVPVKSPARMAEAILKLLQDKELAAKMRKEAKERAKNFSVERMTEETLKVFKETAERQS